MAKTTRLASRLLKLCPGRPSSADIWAQGGAIWRQQLPKSFLIRRRRSSGFRPPTARLTHWTTLRAKKARSSSSSATIVPMLAVIDRMVSDARLLMSESIGFAAICSNDAASYPEDSFENMKRFAKAHDFPFPYLHDETQTVARAYGAVCTPDFFGYNTDRRLKYRGRLDEGRTTPPRAEAPRELVEAMRAIATTGVAPDHQKASIGCSIKWKDE